MGAATFIASWSTESWFTKIAQFTFDCELRCLPEARKVAAKMWKRMDTWPDAPGRKRTRFLRRVLWVTSLQRQQTGGGDFTLFRNAASASALITLSAAVGQTSTQAGLAHVRATHRSHFTTTGGCAAMAIHRYRAKRTGHHALLAADTTCGIGFNPLGSHR